MIFISFNFYKPLEILFSFQSLTYICVRDFFLLLITLLISLLGMNFIDCSFFRYIGVKRNKQIVELKIKRKWKKKKT